MFCKEDIQTRKDHKSSAELSFKVAACVQGEILLSVPIHL